MPYPQDFPDGLSVGDQVVIVAPDIDKNGVSGRIFDGKVGVVVDILREGKLGLNFPEAGIRGSYYFSRWVYPVEMLDEYDEEDLPDIDWD